MSPAQLREVRGKDVAVIFQEPMTALNPVYTVGFQIVETLRLHLGIGPTEAKARAIELLDMVQLPDPAATFDKYPHQLSGGQRQRAMIAMAVSCDPLLLIADEPTTALDVTVQAEILDLLRELRYRLNSAIILITHDLGVVADLADHVIVMKDGRIVERGSVDAIYHHPQADYTKQLIAAVPHLGAVTGRTVLASSTDAPVLRLDDVSIDYPKRGRVPAFRAADDVTFTIGKGEVVGLVGESGSGKTTVGPRDRRAPADRPGLPRGRRGRALRAQGEASPRGAPPDRHRLPGPRFLAQPALPDRPVDRRAAHPVAHRTRRGRRAQGRGAARHGRAPALLPEPLPARAVRRPASARRHRPRARAQAVLLVADEPTSALDVSVQARFLELLKELQAEQGFACLFVSHDLGVVDELAHRIIVMNKGRLVEQGTRDEILRAPKDPYTQRLIAAVPVPDPEEQAKRREARALS